MRIITGKARGLRLTEPKNYDVRPTADRVKESLFNILGVSLSGLKVLDLFAGTGNLGLESWSRGAEAITFVDVEAASLKLVRSNIAKCRAEEQCRVFKMNALLALSRLQRHHESFDVIFCDPPYSKGWVQQVLQHPALPAVLAPTGLLIVEHAALDSIQEALPASLTRVRLEKYGATLLSFIRLQAPGGG